MTDKLASINPSEPFKFWAKKEHMQEILTNYGIMIKEQVDAAEMTKRYLTLEDGTIAEGILMSFCLVKASVER